MRRAAAIPTTGALQSGQAAVETAIVMPLYIFLLLGILQLGLMNQARLLTKYAAYRAARAGSLHNGRVAKMEEAALLALLPVLSRPGQGSEVIAPISNASTFTAKWEQMKANTMPELPSMKLVEVTICSPTKEILPPGAKEVEFDDPAMAASEDWKESQRTKLSVQLTFNYRMPIPFANWIIYRIAAGQELAANLRMGNHSGASGFTGEYPFLASVGTYVLPIRASYTMRMQSNLYVSKAPIPESNQCVVPFAKR